MSQFEMVREFMVKFGLDYEGPPRELPNKMAQFRLKFLEEELTEYYRAWSAHDLEGQLDALVDLVYVALGTARLHGFDFDEAFERVHYANMRKERSASNIVNAERGSSFDVIKPPDWKQADLSDLVRPR